MHVRTITPGDALREAALVLKTQGWIQGLDSNSNGFCLIGAMIQALIVHLDLFPEAYQEVLDAHSEAYNRLYLELEDTDYNDTISGWNDDPDRTKDEVVELLERVARG